MFDLTAGTIDRPFRDPHASATAISLAMHVAIVGSAVWMVFFSVNETLPKLPVMMAFVAEAPVPVPPPPPPPPAAKAVDAVEPAKPVSTHGPTFVAPAEIPVGIQPETLSEEFDGEGGVAGGVEGGIPGGVLGGVLGGMISEAPPPPPPPAPKTPKRVGGDVQAPALIHRVEPEYPPVAVAAKVTGMVILEATVNEQGLVTDVKVLRSIILLDQAAIKAVKQWRYQPLILNGAPVPFILVVTLSFSLR